MSAPIELDGVCVDHGEVAAVRSVDLTVFAGQFVALVGPSGAGKTSLLKTINRLVDATAGSVRFEGRDVREFAPHDLRRRIGYVSQGAGLFPHMSVAENIAITARLLGWPERQVEARIAETLALVSLPRDYLRRFPSALSGGEKQRVAVARALAARPRVVIMDEPFGALDPVTRDALGAAYRDLHESLGLTTVMVTHDVQEAALLADRIVAMRDGAIVADDAPTAMLAGGHPAVADMFEVPRRQAARIAALADSSGAPR